jgi:cytoskeletal protein CcmA (bactofilin family)
MKTVEKPGELNTIIGKGSIFEGNIKVDHSLRVDGKFKGDITSSDTLIVGLEGEIVGNVKVKNVVLGGKINGTLVTQGKTVLESKAEFCGDIKTGKLVIDEGALFAGKCDMANGQGKNAVAQDSDKPNKG